MFLLLILRTGVHYYIRHVLTFASIFGVFPVSGIYKRDVYKLMFHWYSLVTIYSVLLLCGFASIEIFSLDYTIRNLNQDNLTAKGILAIIHLYNIIIHFIYLLFVLPRVPTNYTFIKMNYFNRQQHHRQLLLKLYSLYQSSESV